jgi:hypothetical protein
MFGANPTHHRVAFIIFSSMVVAASCYGYAFYQEELASFTCKNKLNIAKHMQNERITWFGLLSNRYWETNSPFTRTITLNTRPNIHWSCLPS